ncbi:DNA helicase/exodeoxyribonuclease V subunit B [Herbinix hemicellulosilytica]|uniref:ATP-dependent helicase/deoxyribonuclease subunit B n=1 Tax=Herbinix hemicellulosilytica TaxID=1564487 RepID=A0A0H5ST10_HERHM|nr:helicase-exonuclease AddAB subunit AddB [Herbinix hemicellulosilytica]RBP56176.1 DNA helicase/exodeoxyribonuclease V subunit B [Herbinix hemicellulosilytica]CRZ33438.1 ATP-dependent helicase/deoxyribonuclease subunit B [Herbinix hemicellulosilytica]
MSLQLYLGSSGSGKSYQMYHRIIEESIQNPDTNYLIIVPEQFTLQTQKDIVTMHPNHGVMNVDILSFMRFAYRIFDEVGGNDYPVLEDTGKSMVIRKVVEEKKKDLILFGAGVRKSGFVNELKSLLSEFYQYNIRPDDFDKMMGIAEKKPVLRAKLKDIRTIYEGFAEFMRQRYITAEEILVVLGKVIDKSKWLKNSVVCFDGFTGFTPCQNEILAKIMRLAKKVIVTVTIDPREPIGDENAEYRLFGLSQKTIRKLYKIAEETDTLIEEPVYVQGKGYKVPYRFRNSPALAFLEHNLFRYPYGVFKEKQDEISIHSAKNPEGEIAFVVREIKRLVREEGYRYSDIAVVTGDIERYGRLAKYYFSREDIACFIDYKKEILGNPFVVFLRCATLIAEEDYSYESVFGYLRSGLSDITQEETDLLEDYVLAMGIRGANRYLKPFTRTFGRKKAVDLDEINAIRQKLIDEVHPLYEVLKDKDKTVRDYTKALYELGVRLNISEKLSKLCDDFKNLNLPLLAKEYEQVYRIVMDLYDQIVLLLGNEHLSLKEFNDILDAGFAEAKVGLIPPGMDEVVIGDTERTRLKDIRALFFVGVNEGIVPKVIGSGGILSDLERELLTENGIELAPTKRQQAFTGQFYIYLNVTKPKDKLYITFHRVNEEGKSVAPSYLIGKFKSYFSEMSIKNEDMQDKDLDHILGDGGIAYIAEGLRESRISDLFAEIFLYYKNDTERSRILEKMISGAFYSNREKGISRQAAYLLYGENLSGSVTRLERYAGCAFAHFMAYGLSLEERKEYKLAVPDIGNIFHNAIDEFSKMLSSSEYNWHTIPDEIRDDWAVLAVKKAVEDFEDGFLKSSKRNEYLIKRIERITIRTLWALCNQIRQGMFEPLGYEMHFNYLPDKDLLLKGRIDRLDIYEAEDKVYVRVIDYKSGATVFDFHSIYYGLQQQLAIYLSAALDFLSRKYNNKEIIPAGIFYYHIDDPIVAKTEQAAEEIYKSLKMNGLVNEDKEIIGLMDTKLLGPDGNLRSSVKSDIIPVETNKEGELTKRSSAANNKQLKALLRFVNSKLIEDKNRILEGDTRLNPYRMGEITACDFCEYKNACGFDPRLPGFFFRNLAKKPTDELKQEIWGDEEGTYGLDQSTTEGN